MAVSDIHSEQLSAEEKEQLQIALNENLDMQVIEGIEVPLFQEQDEPSVNAEEKSDPVLEIEPLEGIIKPVSDYVPEKSNFYEFDGNDFKISSSYLQNFQALPLNKVGVNYTQEVSLNNIIGSKFLFDIASGSRIVDLGSNFLSFNNTLQSTQINRPLNNIFSSKHKVFEQFVENDISLTDIDRSPLLQDASSFALVGRDSVLSPYTLSIVDPDTSDSDIIFTITSSVTNGQLELASNPGFAIVSFTKEQLVNNQIIYAHDGSLTISDSFDFTVSDNTTTLAVNTHTIEIISDISSGSPIEYVIPTGDVVSNDYFGQELSLTGSLLLSSARGDGSAHIYDLVTGALFRSFSSPEAQSNSSFSQSIYMEGDYAVIGANQNGTGASNSGAAHVYNINTGALLHTIYNPTPSSGDRFSNSTVISGNHLVIGTGLDDSGATDSGAVYIYDLILGTLQHSIFNPTPSSTDYFGQEIDADGNNLIVGAYGDNTGAGDAGSAYIYDLVSGALLHTINNPNPNSNDRFGDEVAIDGNIAAISATFNDDLGSNTGSVYVYDVTTGGLLSTIQNPDPQIDDYFGTSIELFGDYIIIGAVGDDTGALGTGSAYLFNVNTGDLLQTFNNPDPQATDQFGSSLSLSADHLAIGAPLDDNLPFAVNTGTIYTYFGDFDSDGVINGSANDDIIFGLDGDDTLYGDDGLDSLYGGTGADRFLFQNSTAFNDVDRVEDFSVGDGDIIDISNLLTGYNQASDDITDFAILIDTGADALLAVDADGALNGIDYEAVALIVGGAGLDVSTLEAMGNLDGVI